MLLASHLDAASLSVRHERLDEGPMQSGSAPPMCLHALKAQAPTTTSSPEPSPPIQDFYLAQPEPVRLMDIVEKHVTTCLTADAFALLAVFAIQEGLTDKSRIGQLQAFLAWTAVIPTCSLL